MLLKGKTALITGAGSADTFCAMSENRMRLQR